MFAFVLLADRVISKKKKSLRPVSRNLLPMFSSSNFMVSGHTFKSLIHFQLIFVYDVR